jgi:hypothetical protein
MAAQADAEQASIVRVLATICADKFQRPAETQNVGGSARTAAYSQRRPNRIKGINTATTPIIQRPVFGGGWFIW